MIREFKLPDVGEGVAEGELVAWLVDVGEEIEEDQPLAEVETDKALVEIPSPFAGRVAELRAEEGEMVPVGEVIVTVEVEEDGAVEAVDEGGAAEAEPAETEEPESSGGRTFAPPSARRLARELGVDVAAVPGSGPGGRVTEADVRAAAEGDSEAELAPSGVAGERSAAEPAGEAEPADTGAASVEPASRERTLAAPATRRVATELGVDLNAVPASEERDGEPYVTEADVRAFAEAAEPGAEDLTEETEEPAEAAGPTPGERVPYRGVRRSIGEQMERSLYTAPHATHHDEVDVSDLVAIRADLKERTDARLTYMPFVMKAVVTALQEFPYMNASLDEEAEEILLHDEYNVGVATATDAGLLVPVVDDADEKSILDVARELDDLVDRARDRKLAREEMQGGTFSITNVGAIGGEYATPIVNHPEVGILALGAIRERPWVDEGEVVVRQTLTLSLSIDHRVVDGAVAARFTNRIKELLANPHLLLLE
jgi:pyruvate dehydrogenase E2 component (dihydrolipoamide acetyltransferase)